MSYEGQAAIELEHIAERDPDMGQPYRALITTDELPEIQAVDLIRAVFNDRNAHVPRAVIATRFHHGVADLIVRTCELIRERHNLTVVALSDGVFQNVLLLTETSRRLQASGFSVLTHHQIPTNDGGISIGHAVVVGARDRVAVRPGIASSQ